MIYSTKYQKELKIMVLRYLVRVRTTTDKVLEALRNLPYKMYNDEAELSLELSQQYALWKIGMFQVTINYW